MHVQNNNKLGCFSPYAYLSPFRASEGIASCVVLVDLLHQVSCFVTERVNGTFGTDGPITGTFSGPSGQFMATKKSRS